MPTQTFFRLPEEKQRRLAEAGWREFTACSFSEASINRIVREAQIPRGSFYQYFEDKEDLFFFLLGSVRDEALTLMEGTLRAQGGDPFRGALELFDAVFYPDGSVRAAMARPIDVLRVNRNLDMSQMLLRRVREDERIRNLINLIDLRLFLRTDQEFLNEVTALLVFSFACTVRSLLEGGASTALEREKLSTRLELLRRGSLKEESVI